MAEFQLVIKFTPESITESHFNTPAPDPPNNHGRIKYLFRAFGEIFLLFIEIPYDRRDKASYLAAAAQVIAEVNGNL